ncbi:MAG: DNA double-strand break repair nuclease NurA [Candidatus Heimdallarchaeota archaeon]|nr:DNA double-strand break repair nuclease NurA [Candidatus Heimdallarchaeota archaeon]
MRQEDARTMVDLEETIARIKQKLLEERVWLRKFKSFSRSINFLDDPFLEDKLIHKISKELPSISKISGVDGGLISEALAGLDLILYRAVGVTFHGIGDKVKASYTPNFDPSPNTYIAPSLPSRHEFLKLSTLYRLLIEYDVAIQTMKSQNPTVLFLDGRVVPQSSDFQDIHQQSPQIIKVENAVKEKYRELIQTAFDKNIIICGIIKDSRSRSLCTTLLKEIPDWIQFKGVDSSFVKGWRKNLEFMLDHNLAEGILEAGERTSWHIIEGPKWVSPKYPFKIISSLVKLVAEDLPIKIEIIYNKQFESSMTIVLGALATLSQHGLPLAIPTIILEADERVKLKGEDLDRVLTEISIAFNIPTSELRKRRNFTSSLD